MYPLPFLFEIYLDSLYTMRDYAIIIINLVEVLEMRKTKVLFSLVTAMLLGAAFGLSALGLDLELKGGGGLAMGTTDDPNKSGQVRWALDAGLTLDLFLLRLGSISLGVSGGAGYANLNYHSVDKGITIPAPTIQTSDSSFNYLIIPFTLVGKFDIGARRSLTARAGGFAGYFLFGTSDLTYNPEVPPFFVNGEVTLNNSNTVQWMYGLSFYAGLDFWGNGRLSFTPSVEFNMGLTDTSINAAQPTPSKDTFWALTANVGIRYRLLQ